MSAPPALSARLVLDDIQATLNGQAATVTSGFSGRLAAELRCAGLFPTVYVPATARDAPLQAVHLAVQIEP